MYKYIIFRGSDIKDINVCEPPKPHHGLPQDPAIVQPSSEKRPDGRAGCPDSTSGEFCLQVASLPPSSKEQSLVGLPSALAKMILSLRGRLPPVYENVTLGCSHSDPEEKVGSGVSKGQNMRAQWRRILPGRSSSNWKGPPQGSWSRSEAVMLALVGPSHTHMSSLLSDSCGSITWILRVPVPVICGSHVH
ncbi:unnamed protein product [Coregonus sp. 'balchen']|nr:unnamed protein product [Coregonus sp. 'balchen']